MKQAQAVLSKIAGVEGVRAVLLVSGDGFPLETVIGAGSLPADEVAAIARDATAAARKLVEELDQGQLIQGLLEYSKGAVLFTNLPLGMTLIVVARKGVNKAALWNATASNFREILKAL